MKIVNNCIICNGSDKKMLYSGIAKCQGCGHIFSDKLLDEEELLELYSKKYFSGYEYSNYIADRKILQKNFKLRLKILRNFLDPDRHKHLFEIGCAYGFFLRAANSQFESVRGIDISKDAVLYARERLELNAVCGDFLKYDFGNEKFDVVCMWDTIEHLNYPHLYLDRISKHTESGSLLALTTGDIYSLNARIRKNKWRLIHPSTHTHYFSKRTLTKLLEEKGFKIVYNRYCGFYRSVDMVALRTLGEHNKWRWFYNFLRKTQLVRVGFYLNLYDIMYVIARKC